MKMRKGTLLRQRLRMGAAATIVSNTDPEPRRRSRRGIAMGYNVEHESLLH